jgi:preprotein translocase subunit SecA
MVTRSIASAQSQVEAQHFETRKNVLKYDDVLNRQREVIYAERRRVLEGEDLHTQVRDFINDVVGEYVTVAAGQGLTDGLDLDKLWEDLRQLYPVGLSVEEVVAEAGGRAAVTTTDLVEVLTSDAQHAYDQREQSVGTELMRDVERRVLLQVLDRKWREHLYEMDYLKEGIGLRAMAQREPLVEYQREGYQLFQAMMEAIKEEAVRFLFHAEVKPAEQPEPAPAQQLTFVAPSEGGDAEVRPVRADGSLPEEDEAAAVEAGATGNRAERRRARRRS